MICKFSSNNLRKCLTDNKWLINFVLPLSLANRKTIKVLFPEEAEERQNFQELFPDYKSVMAKFESLNIKHQRQSSVSEGAQLVQHQHFNFNVSKIIFVTMSILGIAIVSKASSVVSHIWDLKRFWYQVVYLVHQIWGKNDSKRKFFFDEYLLIFSAIISSGAPCKCEVYISSCTKHVQHGWLSQGSQGKRDRLFAINLSRLVGVLLDIIALLFSRQSIGLLCTESCVLL